MSESTTEPNGPRPITWRQIAETVARLDDRTARTVLIYVTEYVGHPSGRAQIDEPTTLNAYSRAFETMGIAVSGRDK